MPRTLTLPYYNLLALFWWKGFVTSVATNSLYILIYVFNIIYLFILA